EYGRTHRVGSATPRPVRAAFTNALRAATIILSLLSVIIDIFNENINNFLAMILFGFALSSFAAARRMVLKPIDLVLAQDTRPPVIYLRSFVKDQESGGFLSWKSTIEQQVASVMRDYGPVIAIGKPGESLPVPDFPHISR